MGNITIQGDLTGDVPGGEVGGASNLTTAGAIPYVSAPGTLNQDPTALFWDAANDRLGIGTNAPAYKVDLQASTSGSVVSRVKNNGTGIGYFLAEANNGANRFTFGATNTEGFIYGETSHPLAITTSNVERARFTAGGNFLIGTTTDSNFKLDVATSGSAGTARFYDQTATTGKTAVSIRAGAGDTQSDRLLAAYLNDGSSLLFNVGPNSNISTTAVGFQTLNQRAAMVDAFGNGGGFILGSTFRVSWSTTASIASGSYDLSLSRASAGVLQVGDGGSNANGQVSATRVLHAGVPVAALPAAAAGNAGSIQYVTDANATTIGSTVAGGGANKVMVWSDGAAWKIFAS